jgi:hypothetical protein
MRAYSEMITCFDGVKRHGIDRERVCFGPVDGNGTGGALRPRRDSDFESERLRSRYRVC